jgi:hypothetical protein
MASSDVGYRARDLRVPSGLARSFTTARLWHCLLARPGG